MPPPSLLQLCTATAIRNVKYLNDIGSLPYVLARPFLLKIESPEKLRSLELLSPHIIKDDHELWYEFIKRDIPKWEEYNLPEQSDCWYDIYCDLRERVQKSVEEDAEKLKMALDGINSERAKHSAKFVTDRRILPLPRERPTAKQRYASYDRRMGGITPVFSSSRNGLGSSDPLGSPAWSFERPAVPREAKKKSNIFNVTKRNTVLAIPTKQLNNRASQVRQAPRSLIEEHRRPEPTATQRKGTPTLIAPGRSKPQSTADFRTQNNLIVTPSLREREARLRTFTSGGQTAPQTSNSHESSSVPSKAAPRVSSSSARSTSLRNAPTSPPTQDHFESLPGGVKNNPRTKISDPQNEANPEDDESKTSPTQPPRPAVVRKRPAASVFIQPKKKKIT